MEFLKAFSIFAVFIILISMYQISNFISCKNYIKCIQHTPSGRVIILSFVVFLAMVNKYLAALFVIFLSIFLFDLKKPYGVFDLYNCEVIDKQVEIDNGITSRLNEKLFKKENKKNKVCSFYNDMSSSPASFLENEGDEIPMLDIKSIQNVKFEHVL